MVFPILPAQTLADTVSNNSCRFYGDTDLKRLPSATGQSVRGTLSVWVKFATPDTEVAIMCGWDNSGANDNDGYVVVKRIAAGNLEFAGKDTVWLKTTALYRDTSAWYHIVLGIDSAQNSNNSQRLYVNGAEVTAFDTRNNLTNLQDLPINTTAGNDDALIIGCDEDTGGKGLFFNGYMADFFWIDSTQYAASDFGETDEDSGIWKPKEGSDIVDDLTMGTNGVFLEFKESGTGADASGIGADTGGSDLHFTVTNLTALDQCTDTPTNNFATFNPLEPDVASGQTLTPLVYSEGNLKVVGTVSGTGYSFAISTIAVSSGKWYYEFYRPDTDSGTVICGCQNPGLYDSSGLHSLTNSNGGGVGIRGSNGTLYNDGSESSPANGTEYKDAGDILSVKLNMDDNEISFSTNGAAYTSGISLSSSVLSSGFVSPGANIGDDEELIVNFGNPVWALSSGNADANGYGNFEYAVPSGYYAVCTKNLAEYG